MGIPLRVLEAARMVIDDINELIDTSRRHLLNENQLRNAAQSIAANLREAQGRREGAERNLFFRYAAGSSEEADEHLRANYARHRIAPLEILAPAQPAGRGREDDSSSDEKLIGPPQLGPGRPPF